MKNIYLTGLGLILFFCSCYYKKDNPEPAKNVFNPKGTNVIMGCNVDGLNLEVYSQNCSIDRKNKDNREW